MFKSCDDVAHLTDEVTDRDRASRFAVGLRREDAGGRADHETLGREQVLALERSALKDAVHDVPGLAWKLLETVASRMAENTRLAPQQR